MSESNAIEISEKYLQEMLEADDTANFSLYTKRYEEKYLKNFTPEQFHSDIKGMHERNGMNKGYEFLSSLRKFSHDGLDIHRTVWKGVYEKRDAVIELGVYEKDEEWYVILSAVY
ncbi:hypothetical protein [Marinomonas balearica]|uniref:Uncharacterized protein n=1 Tax=Marinomonas balearica TaxID=491947 RepID=A0A4R6MFJ9_9GAMM|nr:hypothetical protein [Marinomonas balearica]TDO98879.1 hypothetical protein DFP79_1294 [Marinomonas balearica]